MGLGGVASASVSSCLMVGGSALTATLLDRKEEEREAIKARGDRGDGARGERGGEAASTDAGGGEVPRGESCGRAVMSS